jgi:hypothetical protein
MAPRAAGGFGGWGAQHRKRKRERRPNERMCAHHNSMSFSCSLIVGSYTSTTPAASRSRAGQHVSYCRSPEQSHSSTFNVALRLPSCTLSSNSRTRVPFVGL